MQSRNTNLQRSIEAFYSDMAFIRKMNGIEQQPAISEKRQRGCNFLVLSTLDAIHLSSRQCDVLSQMKSISSRKKIAQELNISIKTLEDHLLTMRKKMHCQSVQDMFDLVQGGLLLQAA